MSREQDIKLKLRQWIVKRNGAVTIAEVLDETPIISQKLISSVQVLDLILFLESIGGGRLDPSKLQPQSFQSVNNIYQTFFE